MYIMCFIPLFCNQSNVPQFQKYKKLTVCKLQIYFVLYTFFSAPATVRGGRNWAPTLIPTLTLLLSVTYVCSTRFQLEFSEHWHQSMNLKFFVVFPKMTCIIPLTVWSTLAETDVFMRILISQHHSFFEILSNKKFILKVHPFSKRVWCLMQSFKISCWKEHYKQKTKGSLFPLMEYWAMLIFQGHHRISFFNFDFP